MAAAQGAENCRDEQGLTWYLRWKVYTSIPTWTYSQNSLATAEALVLKISAHGTSLKWSQREDRLNQHENSHKLCVETRHPAFEFDKKSMEIETTTWWEFHNGGKTITEQILVLEERNKSKRAGLWES